MKSEANVSASLDAVRGELSGEKLSASTMNLIVWIDDPERRNWVLERAELLAEKHPSFTLILDGTGAQSGATVTASDRGENARVTVRGERVLLDVDEIGPEEIAEYVTALCPRNVPTELWWSSSTEAARPVFRALLPHIDGLVVDSSGALRDAQTLIALARFHREQPTIALRDLAWLRLRPWQDMIAHFFDDPALLDELYTIRTLTIASGSDAEALYLGGWLASRLGWLARGRDAFLDCEAKDISFERRREGEIRRVQSVTLTSDTSSYHGAVTDDPLCVRVWVEGEHARDPRLFTLQAIDNASLLEIAILQGETDELFATALATAATLFGEEPPRPDLSHA
ncbi:MAG TPA: glucose-6-phosphate dehydrogenase assembly protein OpcA [Candidatus Sulfotelmatobacter sp.]|nr:glucose-6-phosphate dehydrogenase assembly protein OpcA [Candidatus Sulfotelmatobacter sp.]